MARFWQLLMVAAVAAGVLLRAIQYFADSSLWVDEAALSRNILDRSFAQLAQPLDYAQSAPIGFLFAQKVMVIFSGSELLLRAIPFAASLTALVVFAALVRRVLTDFGQAMAVTAFALGCPFIYFAAQAKPVLDRCGGDATAHVAAVARSREVALNRLLDPLWSYCRGRLRRIARRDADGCRARCRPWMALLARAGAAVARAVGRGASLVDRRRGALGVVVPRQH